MEFSKPEDHPVSNVRWVPIEKVSPNDYNPNVVPKKELELLHLSIAKDGYTQPIVTIYDEKSGKYIIIDGFHRYFVALKFEDIRESTQGKVPVVVLKRSLADRMAATIRHNRARGEHHIRGMAHVIRSLHRQGWTAEQIMRELGISRQEVIRIIALSGITDLFKEHEYSKAWISGKIHYDGGENESKENET